VVVLVVARQAKFSYAAVPRHTRQPNLESLNGSHGWLRLQFSPGAEPFHGHV